MAGLTALFTSQIPQQIEGTVILLKDGVPEMAIDAEFGVNITVYTGDELTGFLQYIGVGHREFEDQEFICGGKHMHAPVWTSVFLEA